MDIAARVRQVPHWRHKIPLPDGSVTPGTQDTLEQVKGLRLPESLAGKSVLDVGCSDGFFSFECEKRGAARVVAIDDFSSVYIDSPTGFQVAHEILNSKVEFIQGDLFQLDLSQLGKFDLVLFLGVIYHLQNPMYALRKLADVCAGQIVVEGAVVPKRTGRKWQLLDPLVARVLPESYMVFLETDEINRDPTNWWMPTAQCVEGMMRASGFCNVQTIDHGSSRGIFHGFSPRFGNDVNQFLKKYPPDVVQEAKRRESVETVDDLTRLTVPQFAGLKQAAAELVAKKWHRGDRWRSR